MYCCRGLPVCYGTSHLKTRMTIPNDAVSVWLNFDDPDVPVCRPQYAFKRVHVSSICIRRLVCFLTTTEICVTFIIIIQPSTFRLLILLFLYWWISVWDRYEDLRIGVSGCDADIFCWCVALWCSFTSNNRPASFRLWMHHWTLTCGLLWPYRAYLGLDYCGRFVFRWFIG